MAKVTGSSNVRSYIEHKSKKRPGIHSKKRTSSIKSSKHYVKKYRGQGR